MGNCAACACEEAGARGWAGLAHGAPTYREPTPGLCARRGVALLQVVEGKGGKICVFLLEGCEKWYLCAPMCVAEIAGSPLLYHCAFGFLRCAIESERGRSCGNVRGDGRLMSRRGCICVFNTGWVWLGLRWHRLR
jgi:hypothetical protein